jgi:hypothetical protein
VCLQFYRGEGYDAEFVSNLDDVLGRFAGQAAVAVAGADDVCSACPSLSPLGTCEDPHGGEGEIARIDALAGELLGIHPGGRLSLAQVAERLADDAIATGRWRFEACGGCAWEDICEPGWTALVDG